MRVLRCLLGLVLFAAPASAFTATNGLQVQTTSEAGAFEVIARPGSGPRQMWCAAAQYADSALPGNGRVFLSAAISPKAALGGKRSALFTVRPSASLANGPAPGDGGSYTVSITRVGFNLNRGHAKGFCEPFLKLVPRP